MPTVGDPVPSGFLNPALTAGYTLLSQGEAISFTQYRRVVLPLDGWVFWVAAATLGPGALVDGSPLARWMPGQVSQVTTPAPTAQITGSLHVSVETQQDEDATYGQSRVIFTTDTEVQSLTQIAPSTLWVANLNGARFAFSARGRRYRSAGLYHYMGDALYATMYPALVDDPRTLDTQTPVVNNSLSAWLSIPNGVVQLFPSFAVPDNLQPPYGVVHIEPGDTRALQAVPTYDQYNSQQQLVADRVRITLWGLRYDRALDFQAALISYMSDPYGPLGLMGDMPAVRDEKVTQRELAILGEKKRLDLEVSYTQARVRATARKLITEASIQLITEASLSPVA